MSQAPAADIAIALCDRFTALDAVGPYEVLSRLPGGHVRFVAHDAGPLQADTRCSRSSPKPGSRTRRRRTSRMLDWMRGAHEHSQWTTSVCTGSLLLTAAGLLDGVRATTRPPATSLRRSA